MPRSITPSFQRQRSGTPEYAQRILSNPGKMDGLYWPAAEGEPQSPLGPLVAAARAAGYRRSAKTEEPSPYHGYFYKVLTAQGPNAPGGAIDYIVNGRMIGGFGLVAWPARYGDSGVMTFMVNHDGVVYQKNLGAADRQARPGDQPLRPRLELAKSRALTARHPTASSAAEAAPGCRVFAACRH